MNTLKLFKRTLLGSVFVLGLSAHAEAGPLLDQITDLMATHERIRAAEADVAQARSNLEVSKGDYFPTLSTTALWGSEKIATRNKGSTQTETSMMAKEVDLTLTQKVFDFGVTDAAVNSSKLTVDQTLATLEQTRQALLLEALSAQLNLASAKRVLDHQESSESSIKRQTELEDARVQRGSGFSTDVLQAKTQLAGAQAARVRAQGALKQAFNRYRAVFGFIPDSVDDLEIPNLAGLSLPQTEGEIVDLALKNNPQVLVQAIAADIADADVSSSFASGYRPAVEAIAETKKKKDVSGTAGNKTEHMLKLEATFDFNFGWTASNTLQAAKHGHSAAASRLKDTRDTIEEQARNAWQALETAIDNADFLRNQANIAGEFLELARKERTLGQRSLIDVLSGETAHINALAAADRAETDVAIAKLTLMNVMGHLDTSVIQ
ncbi:TolC family protein [Magnetovibrio sp. PR-2]|uniref:TolC family protein n=1 Tax=Magnetovibrio sp. PR-2 TaxID=3120356 RepID=UPI002FCE2BBB